MLFCLIASDAGPAVAFAPSDRGGVLLELPPRPAPQPRPARSAPDLESRAAGLWSLYWDPTSGAAVLGLRGTPPGRGPSLDASEVAAAAEAFRARHAALLGASDAALDRVRCEVLGGAWHVTWQQQAGGREVLGCCLDLALSGSGVPLAFHSTLVPGVQARPQARAPGAQALRAAAAMVGEDVQVESTQEVLVVLPGVAGYEAVAATRSRLRGPSGWRWEALTDETSGRLLALESRIRTLRLDGEARADVAPLYAQDAPEPRPLPWLAVLLGGPSGSLGATCDGSGRFFFDLPSPGTYGLEAGLEGLYVHVVNEAGAPVARAAAAATVPGSSILHFGSAEARLDERTIYFHTNVVHDYAKTRFGFALLDFPMRAVAAVHNPATGNPDYANAFWDGDGINFGNGGGNYQNFGLFADVIYHEYVHGVTDYMYRPGGDLRGSEGAAIHEALSDYFACTITGEPLVGENLTGGGGYLRDLDNQLQWPADSRGEEHADGEILGGALWDVRELVGPAVADAVIHFARALFPQTFEEYATAMLVQDDLLYGDGAPGNGSPHRDEILTAFASHGMGAAVSRRRSLAHEPLHDTEDAGVARRVRAGFDFGISTTSDTLLLHWSNSGPFVVLRMQRQADGSFLGQIPGQPEGTDVRYWLSTQPRRGQPTLVHPAGAPATAHAFHVGPDRQPPTILHTPRTAAAAFSWPAQLIVDLDDNLGLAYAYVEYLRNGAPGGFAGLVRDTGDPTRYTTQFPNVGALGDTIEYWIVATDASRAANTTRLPSSGGFRFELGATLQEDFESGGPWSHRTIVLSHPDPWHVSDVDDHTPGGTHAWRCGVEGGEYPGSVAAELVTDTYLLGRGASATVWSRMDSESNGPAAAWDGGLVQIQEEGHPGWQALVPEGGYSHLMSDTGGMNVLPPGTPCLSGRDADWRLLRFDLGAWSRKRVCLRFLFGSDNVPSAGEALRGWVLDDFGLDPGWRDPADAAGTLAPGTLLGAPPSPNPSRGRLAFLLHVPPRVGPVRLDLFDARGRRVRRLLEADLPIGTRQVFWDGRSDAGLATPSGVYYYRLRSRLGVERGRVIVLR